jgi:pimeloyl-ACP methyl ester carboxylesterase
VKTVVIYVHGLWFSGREGWLLRMRLARALGAEERAFSYRSVSDTISASSAALKAYLATVSCDTLHLVGHSLGGVVIVDLFRSAPRLPPGRILLLGSPLLGSEAACAVARLPLGKQVLGRGVAEQVLQASPGRWDGRRDLGIIAGSMAFGIGRLVRRFEGANDGTILVAETRLVGAREHLVLPVTHTGLLVSREVARQGAAFLRDGRFIPCGQPVP